jgi:hypothetical protein
MELNGITGFVTVPLHEKNVKPAKKRVKHSLKVFINQASKRNFSSENELIKKCSKIYQKNI